MTQYRTQQKIYSISNVELGGQPGEVPTVLIGSIFHEGHGIVRDRACGEFDAAKARCLISGQERMSKKTGIPCMLDVVADTPQAMERNLDFVAGHTDAPLLVNGPNAEVRIHGMQHAKKLGILDRVVYDSISYAITDEEIKGIRATGVEAALVQAFNPRQPTPEGMVEIVSGNGGLLEKAERAGISKQILFAPVLDLPSIGFAARGVNLLKGELGLPTGTAPVGVIGRSKQVGSMGVSAKGTCRAAVVALCQSMGADFIIYGTVARAPEIFPACAVIDVVMTYDARTMGVRPRSGKNPLKVLYGTRS